MTVPITSSITKGGKRIRLLAWAAALVLAVTLASIVFVRSDRPSEFASYFTAAHLVGEGQPIDRFYDNAWFSSQADRLVPGSREIYNANVPTTALFYAPFALFENYGAARLVWTAVSIAALVWLIESLIKVAGLAPSARAFAYLAVLFAQPIEADLLEGQTYIVVAAALVIVLSEWSRNREFSAGAALGTLFAYKSAGIMVWPIALAARKWRIVMAGFAVVAIAVIATLSIVGVKSWLIFVTDARAVAASAGMRSTAYQSVESIVRHLSSAQGTLGVPIYTLPLGMAQALGLGAALLLLAITAYATFKNPEDELVFGAGILLTVCIVPVSQLHTYTIAMIPIAQLLRRSWQQRQNWKLWATWLGSMLIILPSPFRSRRLIDGWYAFLAYPKLYGALLLLAAAVALILEKGQSQEVPAPAERQKTPVGGQTVAKI